MKIKEWLLRDNDAAQIRFFAYRFCDADREGPAESQWIPISSKDENPSDKS